MENLVSYQLGEYKIQDHEGFGEALTVKWGTGMCSPEDPLFSHPPGHSQDLHFSIFQFSRPYFHHKITNL